MRIYCLLYLQSPKEGWPQVIPDLRLLKWYTHFLALFLLTVDFNSGCSLCGQQVSCSRLSQCKGRVLAP